MVIPSFVRASGRVARQRSSNTSATGSWRRCAGSHHRPCESGSQPALAWSPQRGIPRQFVLLLTSSTPPVEPNCVFGQFQWYFSCRPVKLRLCCDAQWYVCIYVLITPEVLSDWFSILTLRLAFRSAMYTICDRLLTLYSAFPGGEFTCV